MHLDEVALAVKRTYSANVLVPSPKGLDEDLLPIAPLLARILSDAVAGKRHDAPIVTKSNGQGPSESGVDGALRRIQGRLNARRVEQGQQAEKVWSLHKFRQYFASKVRKGCDAGALRRLMRHKSLESTARYLLATAGDLKQAVAPLPSALPGASSGNRGETPTGSSP